MNKGFVVAGGVVGAAALLYLEASLALIGRLPFRTYVDGEDVSLQTVAQAAQTLQNSTSDYTLTIQGRNGLQDTITADEISLTVDQTAELTDLQKARGILEWPLSLLTRTDYTTSTEAEFNEEQLTGVISSLVFNEPENVIPPTDASYQLVDGTYEIVQEDAGAQLDSNKTLSAIGLAIASGEATLDLDAAGCYVAPSITAENGALSADISTLNQFTDLAIHIPIGADDGEDITAETIVDWIVNEDAEQLAAEAAAITAGTETAVSSVLPTGFMFDEAKITEYVEGLSEKYNTYGKDHTFKTQAGDEITITIGNYGWWLNQDETKSAILTALQSGVGGEVEPVWVQQAAQWPTEENGNDDIGGTYAEVDLDNQHVYMVVDGEVVMETDCVSGKAIDGHATPDGIYRLTYKQRDATLVGQGYASPVSYWMPFNLGVGFHDATWRSSFGGQIYISSGSHGCVNLPYSKAGELYSYVYTGMPVIVYGGMGQADAKAYVSKNGSTAGTGTTSASSSSSSSSSASSETADENTESNDDANAAAENAADQAADQLTAAAQQIASQIYSQQIAAGATEADALAAAQAAANQAIANATGAAQ